VLIGCGSVNTITIDDIPTKLIHVSYKRTNTAVPKEIHILQDSTFIGAAIHETPVKIRVFPNQRMTIVATIEHSYRHDVLWIDCGTPENPRDIDTASIQVQFR